MSKRAIVVPLDGSELAERALPYAAEFAKALDARLLLITVWEGADETLELVLKSVAEDLFATAEKRYEEYLFGVAKKITDVPVDAEVLAGHPADEIVRLIRERDVEMLALSSHGRSGLGRLWFGSVANQLIRRTDVPRLVIGPEAMEQPAGQIKGGRILVPLDGSQEAEAALQPAKRFAKLFDAEVVVAQVLGWASHAFVFDVPPTTVSDIDKELTKASGEYLARAAERLGKERPVRTDVLHGPVAESLSELVAKERVGLVVMTTHGRGGLARVALGSVADRMLHARAPVLLVSPGT
jgi:nucleotide-binding universal stress UspA family protein